MSWSTELWDQFDGIAAHTQKGIEFCEKQAHFMKERAAIENDYAAKLKKLVKNYQPKKRDDESDFSYAIGFQKMVSEVHDVANQHECIAENLITNIQREIVNLISELKQERKKYLQDGAKQHSQLQVQVQNLEKAKKSYEKSFRESEKAQENYKRADADLHLSRAELEKAKNLMMSRQQTCESCKNEYAGELQKTNEYQSNHYQKAMPEIFQFLQDMEEKRICRIQEFLRQSAEVERSVMPIINTCIDGMTRGAESINASNDSKLVIDRYKSGFVPPGDIPFEDLSNGNFPENANNAGTPGRANSLRTDSLKGTTSGVGNKGKKRGGIFGIFSGSKLPSLKESPTKRLSIKNGIKRTDDSKDDYSHLPPTQQKKKLTQKIEGTKQVIAKETAERDGMLKMRDVYVQNPQLGDPSSLDKQLEENAQKLDRLRHELAKFEGYLAEADNRSSQLNASSEAINSGMADVSISHQQRQQQPDLTQHTQHVHTQHTQHTEHRTSITSTVVEDKRSSTANSERESYAPVADQDSFDELDDEFQIIGTCQALYTFDASNEGSIAMTEGEQFSVVEQDQGDGWTRVRRSGSADEGFVPTSYIRINIYNQ